MLGVYILYCGYTHGAKWYHRRAKTKNKPTNANERTSERINKPIAPPKYTVVRQQIAIDFGNASALWIQLDITARVCIFSYPSGCARKGKIFAFRLKVISARDCTSGHNTATFFSSHSAIRRWYCTFGGPTRRRKNKTKSETLSVFKAITWSLRDDDDFWICTQWQFEYAQLYLYTSALFSAHTHFRRAAAAAVPN